MVGAYQHLGHQAHESELHRHQREEDGYQEKGLVFDEDAVEELVVQGPGGHQARRGEQREAQPAEEVDRLGYEIAHELHGEEVQDDLEGPRQPVLGAPGLARPVVHRQLRYRGAGVAEDGGQEAVHFPVKVDRLQQ